MYADMLKKQFSLETNPQSQTNTNNRPPQKRPAKLLDYNSDQSIEYPPLVSNNVNNLLASTNAPNHPSANVSATTAPAPTTTVDYAAELQLIKMELATLRTLINSAVEQMKSAIESLKMNTPVPACEMEINDDHSTDCSKETTPELSHLITELKNDIATIAIEMQDKFKEFRAPPQPIPFQLTPFPM